MKIAECDLDYWFGQNKVECYEFYQMRSEIK